MFICGFILFEGSVVVVNYLIYLFTYLCVCACFVFVCGCVYFINI